jgi:hypothetical protein
MRFRHESACASGTITHALQARMRFSDLILIRVMRVCNLQRMHCRHYITHALQARKRMRFRHYNACASGTHALQALYNACASGTTCAVPAQGQIQVCNACTPGTITHALQAQKRMRFRHYNTCAVPSQRQLQRCV